MKTYLIEAYVGRVEWADVERLIARADRCALALSRDSTTVRPMWTILIREDETCLCLVRASDLEVVERVAGAARLNPLRIVEVLDGRFDPAPANVPMPSHPDGPAGPLGGDARGEKPPQLLRRNP